MPHTITATFENGVFIPHSKIDLPEHATVKVVVPDPQPDGAAKNLKGSLAGLGVHLSAEDFDSARHTLWQSFPRDIP